VIPSPGSTIKKKIKDHIYVNFMIKILCQLQAEAPPTERPAVGAAVAAQVWAAMAAAVPTTNRRRWKPRSAGAQAASPAWQRPRRAHAAGK